MKTNKLVSCPQCGGFGFTSTPVSTDYEITVCRAKTCELCHGAGVIEGPMTNADRIRAMNDEELVEFIKNIKVRAALCKAVKNNDAFEELCSAEWLQMPAEEDDHDERKENENVRR